MHIFIDTELIEISLLYQLSTKLEAKLKEQIVTKRLYLTLSKFIVINKNIGVDICFF